ncbi:hypothetical protein MVES_003169 [Malassezia vespertilionis]|uniref:COP9 signalosome complex subunit 3 N-terminal helical repeats domain-containing protein n=1 Tax=Malassezia vespertilionis TaxID=2020962 RepID=A0A2N1J8P0_9BASI|nr:hypothetical protein MVES_003169 [Malassezia vespertilionis]
MPRAKAHAAKLESMLAAVATDPAAAEELRTYVPPDPSPELDVLLAHEIDAVRAPLASLMCLNAALRLAASRAQVKKIVARYKPLLEGDALRAQLPHAPVLAAQWAQAVSERSDLVEDARPYAIAQLEAIRAMLSRNYQGITGADAPLLYAYNNAVSLAAAVDVDATNFQDHIGRAVDVLAFLYYAGLAYAKTHDYDAAIHALETCIAVPSEAVSWIQLDAFKKLVLLRLLCHGVCPDANTLCRSASSGVRGQYLRDTRDAYLAFRAAYMEQRSGTHAAATVATTHRAQFEQDANWGLVCMCMALQRRRWIEALARVYTSIPLRDIAAHINASEQHTLRELEAMDARITFFSADAPALALPEARAVANAGTATFVRFHAPVHAPVPVASAIATERRAAEELAHAVHSATTAPPFLAQFRALVAGPAGPLYAPGLKGDAVLDRVRTLRRELAEIGQGAIATTALDPYCKELIKPSLLRHRDRAVQVQVACILSDMLRLYAPNAPFTPAELKSIFQRFLDVLVSDAGLAHPQAPLYADAVYIAESLGTVKSIVLICELPSADALVSAYFARLFALLDGPIAANVQLFLTEILVQLIEEGNALPAHAMEALMAAFDKDASPAATALAAEVCRRTQDRLQKQVAHYFSLALERDEDDAPLPSDQILRIASHVPSLLTSVVPQLEAQLGAPHTDTRICATDMLGALFAMPGDFAALYPSTWRAWLARTRDTQAAVRVQWIKSATLLLTHTLRDAVAAPFAERVADLDEKVRLAAAHALGALDLDTLAQVPRTVLTELARRGKDRRSAVRDAAFAAIGRAYRLAYPHLAQDAMRAQFAWIPNAVLQCSLAGVPSIVASVRTTLEHALLPFLDTPAFAAQLVCVADALDDDGFAGLLYYTNLHFARPSAVDAFLDACSQDDVQPTAAIRACCAALRDERAEAHLAEFAAWRDARVLRAMRLCFDPATPLDASNDARRDALDTVKAARPALVDTIASVLWLGSYPILNQSCMPILLDKGAARLCRYVAEHAPQLLVQHADLLAQRALNGPDALALECLASVAVAFPAHVNVRENAALFGDAVCGTDARCAQYAATVLAALSAPAAHTALEECVPILHTHAELGAESERVAALAALAPIFRHDFAAVESRADALVEHIVQQILLAPWHGALALAARVASLELLTSFCLGQASVVRVAPLLKLFWVLVRSGEARADLGTPPDDAACIRRCAALSVLQLAEAPAYAAVIIPRMGRLAYALQDESFEVRSALLQNLLLRLSQHTISPSFHALLSILAFDPEEELRARVVSYHRRAAAAMLEGARAEAFDAAFLRFLYILAHHPDFAPGSDEVVHIAQYIEFFLGNVGTPQNMGALMAYARALKRAVDAAAPPHHVEAQYLYIISELAQLVVQRFAEEHGWTMETHQDVALPADILGALPPAEMAQVQETRYLDDRLVEQVQARKKKRAQHTKESASKRVRSAQRHSASDDAS